MSLAACGDNKSPIFEDGGIDGDGSDIVIDAPDAMPDALDCGASPNMNCGGTCTNTNTDNNNCGACGTACTNGQSCVTGICCDAGQANCGGSCVDLTQDEAHCGTCATACDQSQTCMNGTCCGGSNTACGNQCFDLQNDDGHCGDCNTACSGGTPDCDAGMCCPSGWLNCGGTCVDPNSDAAHCGACGTSCSGSQTCDQGLCCTTGTQDNCNGTCTDITTNTNCGACGTSCGAGESCTDGVCCTNGTQSCNGTTCTDTNTDESNCGGCAGSGGTACTTGETCLSGLCCGPGEAACGAACVDKLNDPNNCGSCGNVCGSGGNVGLPVCGGGVCQSSCSGAEVSCNGACVLTDSDHENCGGCGNACADDAVCNNGSCSTSGCTGNGEQACNGDCVNVQTDANNCGMCGTVCPAADECVNGQCQLDCPGTQVLCNGVCADLNTDAGNCGTCGTSCGAGGTCQSGLCCGPGQTRCGNACFDLDTTEAHCGNCATACPASGNNTCQDGLCCTANQQNCNGTCSDPMTDEANCGACGTICSGGATCDGGICCGAGTYNSSGKCCATGTVACNINGTLTCVNFNDATTCGTTCGNAVDCTATANKLCINNTCTLNCTGGTTNCSGNCADLQTDEFNCGVCDNVCPTGSTCTNGTCSACPSGPPTGCNGACTDTTSDPQNCGGCNMFCTVGQTCNAGKCCPTGTVNCNGACVDTNSDEANCGACAGSGGDVCGTGETCTNGSCTCGFGQISCGSNCITPSVDPLNCGTCGNVCGVGTNLNKPYCVSNGCVATCPAPLTGCAIGAANGPKECVNTFDDNDHCSDTVGSCGIKCPAGKGCVFGTCVDQFNTATPPAKCVGGGPPIILPTGGSGGGSVCSGSLGATAFTFGLCSRTNIGPLTKDLFTDAFNSLEGPYRPIGTSGANKACSTNADCGTTGKCIGDGTTTYPKTCAGGGIGVNGTVGPVASNNGKTHVGGDFWVFGSIGLVINDQTTVKQRFYNKAAIEFTKTTNKVFGDAFINGPWSTQGQNGMTIVGNLTTQSCASVPGSVTRASCTSAPFSSALLDPCGKADGSDGSLIPVRQIVEYFRNPANNDNAAIGLSPDALVNPASDVHLELPCGNYYFSSIGGSQKLALKVTGRTAIYIGGAVNINVDMIFDVDPTASLDMFVGGVVRIAHPITLGSPAYPRLTRMYIGSSSVAGSGASCTSDAQCYTGKCTACNDSPYAACTGTGTCVGGSNLSKAIDMSQGGNFNGLLWAGYGDFSSSNDVEMYGSIFANYLGSSGALTVHYDNGAVQNGNECPTPPPSSACESCRDCNNQACINNTCAPTGCTTDSQCCPPLHCDLGTGSCKL